MIAEARGFGGPTLVRRGAWIFGVVGVLALVMVSSDRWYRFLGGARASARAIAESATFRGLPQDDDVERLFAAAAARRAPRLLAVCKSQRQMRLYLHGVREAAYKVQLGWTPVPPKEVEGDGRTPEGDYRICTKNPKSRFHLSLGISYPGAADAERALARGTIDRSVANRIASGDRKGQCPPWSTRLGGEIFIHGSGSGSDTDWTNGCVAVTNPEMDVLFALMQVDDPVVIFW